MSRPATRWALAFVWSNPPLLAAAATLFRYLRAHDDIDTLVVTDTLDGKLDLLARGVLACTLDDLVAKISAPALWVDPDSLAELLRHEPVTHLDVLVPDRGSLSSVRRERFVRQLAAACEQVLIELAAGCVFVWNGWLAVQGAFVLAAKRRGLPVYYLERGLLPGTLTVDPHGVNYASRLAGATWQEMAAPYASDDERRLVEETANRLATSGTTVVAQGAHVSRAQARASLGLGPDQRVVLLPLQLESDSNVVAYSPLYRRMDDLVRAVHQALAREPSTVLVMRPHPEAGQMCPGVLDHALPRVLTAPGLSLHSLLAACDVVVTINSTVGLEAALQSKAVVVVGNAIYGEKGFTYDAHQADQLAGLLHEALQQRELSDAQKIARDRFVSYLCRHVLFSLEVTDPWCSQATIAADIFACCAPATRSSRLSIIRQDRRLMRLLSPAQRGRSLLVLAPQGGNGLASELRGFFARYDPLARVDEISSKSLFKVIVTALLGRYRGGIATCPALGKRGVLWRTLPIFKADISH